MIRLKITTIQLIIIYRIILITNIRILVGFCRVDPSRFPRKYYLITVWYLIMIAKSPKLILGADFWTSICKTIFKSKMNRESSLKKF